MAEVLSGLRELDRTVGMRTIEAESLAVEARAASKAKSRFLSTMRHEFRTPLAGILGMTALLTETVIDPDDAELLLVIQRSAQRLEDVLDAVLDFARLSEGALTLEQLDFDLAAALANVVSRARARAHTHGLEVDILLDDELPIRVNGDPTRLQQVLDELLGNALKFAGRGRITLECTADQGHHRFVVSDQGPGFAQADLDRLLAPFVQGDSSSTRAAGGAGLGLALCDRLAALMGGSLKLANRAEGGARVLLSVPLGRWDG